MDTWEQALGGQRGSLQHPRRLPGTRDSSGRWPEPLSAQDRQGIIGLKDVQPRPRV